jgi:hypothetical protein
MRVSKQTNDDEFFSKKYLLSSNSKWHLVSGFKYKEARDTKEQTLLFVLLSKDNLMNITF